MQQLNQITTCFSSQFCKINRMARVGKNIKTEQLKLKKIYLAYRAYNVYGQSCDISCFLINTCNNC